MKGVIATMINKLKIGDCLFHKELKIVEVVSLEDNVIRIYSNIKGTEYDLYYYDLGKVLYFEEDHKNKRYPSEDEYLEFVRKDKIRIIQEEKKKKEEEIAKEKAKISIQNQKAQLKHSLDREPEYTRTILNRLNTNEYSRIFQNNKVDKKLSIKTANIKGTPVKYIYDYLPYNKRDLGSLEEIEIMYLIMDFKYNPKDLRNEYEKINPELKETNHKHSIEHFSDIIVNKLNFIKNTKDLVICNIPSSKVGNVETGTYELAHSLIRKTNNILKKNQGTATIEFGGDNIIRHAEVVSAHTGGMRNESIHLNSIKIIDKNKFKDKNILLIDDVLTTGNTMLACKKIIEDCNPKSILCLTLARTIDFRERLHSEGDF